MNKAVRKAVIAGNWKMNKTPAEAKELITAIAPLVKDAGCDVVACVPYVDIATAIEAARAPTSRSAQRTATGRSAALSPARFPQKC